MARQVVILVSEAHRLRALDLVRNAPLEMAVIVQDRTRTLDQNAALHSALTDIAEQVRPDGRAYDKDTWRLLLKIKFFGKDVRELPTGEIVEVEPHSRFRNRAEFSEFIEFVYAFGTESGVRWTG